MLTLINQILQEKNYIKRKITLKTPQSNVLIDLYKIKNSLRYAKKST